MARRPKTRKKEVRCPGVREDHLEFVKQRIADAGIDDSPSDGLVLRLALCQFVKAIKSGTQIESLITA